MARNQPITSDEDNNTEMATREKKAKYRKPAKSIIGAETKESASNKTTEKQAQEIQKGEEDEESTTTNNRNWK